MNDEKKDKPKSYKVILKSGDFAVFPNNNNYNNYPDRLVSGIYGVVNGNGENLPITRDTVLSIEEVTDDAEHNAS